MLIRYKDYSYIYLHYNCPCTAAVLPEQIPCPAKRKTRWPLPEKKSHQNFCLFSYETRNYFTGIIPQKERVI
jgi:hypothetical protein